MLPHKKLNNKLGKMTLKCESCTKFSWWWIGWKVVNETHRQPEIEEGGLMHTQREPTEIVWRTYTQTLCSHRYTHSHRYFPEKGGKADWTLKDCARALFAFFFFAVVFSLSLSLFSSSSLISTQRTFDSFKQPPPGGRHWFSSYLWNMFMCNVPN